jgi:uncharacterized protein
MANRLAQETSPYLLQHRNNPVDWYPWGEEALTRAREEDRPILLSIGYSACHWCHVMEHESFEDAETARLMNEHFVNVKVDREERPDIDSLYMAAVQQMTGHGGWPMTMFLTPAGSPFYGGTYFPPAPKHGLPSFRQVLLGVSQAYHERREQVEESAEGMLAALRESTLLRPPPARLQSSLLQAAEARLAARFDEARGGFGGAPKFPQPMLIEFMLRRWRRDGSEKARSMALSTLRAMARGGIYDQVGGGFHRYSVDAEWLVPHFEKMLYDNALLARVYLHGYQVSGDAELRRVVEEVLDYVLREMRSPEGGFHSAQDADSEGVEGRFYVWSSQEVDEVLGSEEGPIFRRYLDITPGGNWEGVSIARVKQDAAGVADELGIDEQRLAAVIERGRRLLYSRRAERVAPAKDDKALTAWNAMMIRALAEAGWVLERPDYSRAAVEAAEFVLTRLREGGRLLRTYRAGTAKIDAFLEDHALLCSALITLFETTSEPRWLNEAGALADVLLERFWDEDERVFYDTAADGEALVVRPRDYFDNATPSGNSAAVSALLRLTALLGEERYERVAVAVMETQAGLLEQIPQGFGELLCALDFFLAPPREVAVVGATEEPGTRELLDVLRTSYLPEAVVAFRDDARDSTTGAGDDVPLLRDRERVDGRATAYVCRRFTCGLPATDVATLRQQLEL